jgi:phenylpropionate dioxygenase-like ring-hydroxylating dioxygenase large terminal subunit
MEEAEMTDHGLDPHKYTGYYDQEDVDEDAELTHVGPKTPAGEYLRRFWHGIATSSELGDLPLLIRIMGEDLVLFRDKSARIGLLKKHCSHRRASLEYGRLEERGIRCCYHGWLYDVDGRLLEAPAEPPDAPLYKSVRQGAYPVKEYKGLIFAYLGPPERTPEFPIYDTFEMPGTEMVPYTCTFPCNWLQVTENGIDPVHSMYLHTLVNEPQFSENWGILGDVKYHDGDLSVYCTIARRIGDNLWFRMQENLLPNITQSGAVHEMDGCNQRYFGRNTFLRWCLPLDDTNTKVVAWAKFGARADPVKYNNPQDIERLEQGELFNRPHHEVQRNPGDYVAMVGQGPIVVHAKEHMGTSDRGVALFRRRLRKEIRALADGVEPRQPMDSGPAPIPTWSGDTVLRIPPAITNRDDHALAVDTLAKVIDILGEGGKMRGAERDDFIISRLKELEAV